ncbi:MAG: ATP-binding protein [Gammaproteobacteria bacterium]
MSHTASPAAVPAASLRRILLSHELVLLVLVLTTGLFGGLAVYIWQQASNETFRVGTLLDTAHRIRSDLYRQIKEVTRARLMEDPQALRLYADYSRRIDAGFNGLRREATTRPEDAAIQALQQAYRVIQHDMNAIFTDPYLINRVVQLKILDFGYEQRLVRRFEIAFEALDGRLRNHHAELYRRLRRWSELTPLLLPIPVLLAMAMLLASRRSLKQRFVRPMEAIIGGADTMRAGNLAHRIPVGGVRETQQLAEALNQMAADLSTSRDAQVESERQAAMGALVPVVAHNIRNPLASIRASAQLLEHAEGPAELQEIKDAVIETVDRLGRWVSTLVSYLHPLQPRPRASSWGAIAGAALRLLENKRVQKDIEVSLRGLDAAPIRVDVDLMEQAVYGLIANAIEASPPGARLLITARRAERQSCLCIEDQGPGLPFQPAPGGFAPGPSTKRFGTGLGIPFAFKVCQGHGARLRFENLATGGTRVSILLPE